MAKRWHTKEPVVRSILEWAARQATPPLPTAYVPGADERERRLLAALGGVAKLVSEEADGICKDVPTEIAEWWAESPLPPPGLASEVLSVLESGRDLLGELYTTIVSQRSRRNFGTVFTPPSITAHMLDQCERHGAVPATVIDPGAGVGAFTLEAACRWSVPVVAVDLNAVTLGLLAARCHLAGYDTSASAIHQTEPQVEGPVVHLVRQDFLQWLPETLQLTHSPALIVGNPPYTRHQAMEQAAKEQARRTAGPLVSSGLAGMAGYFLAAALDQLRPDDGLCMVLPSSWMHTRYGRGIREHLWALANRPVRLEVFPHRAEVFPRSKVDTVIVFVGPVERLRQDLTAAEVSVEGTTVKMTQARQVVRDTKPPATFPRSLGLWDGQEKGAAVELKDIFAIHRGVATGRNDFFLLTDAEARKRRIPEAALAPAVGSLRGFEGDTLDETSLSRLRREGMRSWLLLLTSDDEQEPNIAEYLKQGVKAGVPSGFLASQRQKWFVLPKVRPAPLLLVPMTKRVFRVVRNSINVRHTNSLYGLHPLTEDIDVDAVVHWFRSEDGQAELRRVARRYGSRMLKLEPSDVGRVRLPPALVPPALVGK